MSEYKNKALDHVRSVCPELTEAVNEPAKKIVTDYGHGTLHEESPARCYFKYNTPHLEHWLRGLHQGAETTSLYLAEGLLQIIIGERDNDFAFRLDYNLTKDGENQSEEFYKAYCEIVGVS